MLNHFITEPQQISISLFERLVRATLFSVGSEDPRLRRQLGVLEDEGSKVCRWASIDN
jgi:hypothetical protein